MKGSILWQFFTVRITDSKRPAFHPLPVSNARDIQTVSAKETMRLHFSFV